MGSIENVILVVTGIAFWTLIIALPVMIFRRLSDLRHRVAFLETELRRLAAKSR